MFLKRTWSLKISAYWEMSDVLKYLTTSSVLHVGGDEVEPTAR